MTRSTTPSTTYKINDGPTPNIVLSVQPGETIMASRGTILSTPDEFRIIPEIFSSNQQSGNGRASSFLSGEGPVINLCTNKGNKPQDIILSDQQIGAIVPITEELNEGVICVRGAFFAATTHINVGPKKIWDFGQALLTRQSPWMQHCKNPILETPSTAFFMAVGKPEKIELEAGEKRLVAKDSFFAFTEGTQVQLHKNKSLIRAFTSGQDRYMVEAEGPGTIWVTSKNRGGGNAFLEMLANALPG